MDDAMDSTIMHINKGNVHGTQRERTNGDNIQHNRLLPCLNMPELQKNSSPEQMPHSFNF